MKEIILSGIFLFFLPIFLSAQLDIDLDWLENKDYYNKVIGEVDPDFNITETPGNYKDEPVVILCQKYYFSFLKGKLARQLFGYNAAGVKGIYRKRIKIQDASALAKFSAFYFQESKSFGISIIKPNGKKIRIDMRDAIEVSTQVPRFYKTDFQNSSYYKIAIPNLEVGDIIDYFSVYLGSYETGLSLATQLSTDYPVAKQAYIFDIGEGWSFYYRSLNGASSFVKVEELGQDDKGEPQKEIIRLVFDDEYRAKYKRQKWDFPYLSEPTIKFIAFRSINRSISNTMNVKNIALPELRPFIGKATGFPKIKGVAKKRKWAQQSEQVVVKELYQVLRHMLLEEDERSLDDLKDTYELDVSASMNTSFFISVFKSFLDRFDIENSLVYAVPKYFGTMSNAISPTETQLGVYVHSTKKYYFPPNLYSRAGEIPAYLDHADIITLSVSKPQEFKAALKSAVESKLPIADSKEHLQATIIQLQFSEDMKEQKLVMHQQYHNSHRQEKSKLFLFNTDYKLEDDILFYHPLIFPKSFKEGKGKDNPNNPFQKFLTIRSDKISAVQKEREPIKRKAIENYFKDEYGIKELIDYQIINNGRFGERRLSVQLDFVTENLIKKAGDNYLFSVGRLIGEQVQLKEDDILKRTKDIYFGTSKLFTNTIDIEIPKGYVVEGVKHLNVSVDNEYVSFISNAVFHNNKLTITTTKDFKKPYVPVQDWDKVVAVVEAVDNFTQTKVVLKKDALNTPTSSRK